MNIATRMWILFFFLAIINLLLEQESLGVLFGIFAGVFWLYDGYFFLESEFLE